MAKAKRAPGYVLPHNPLTAAGVLEELKRIKGDKTWLQWELELLTAQYPDNATFKTALEQYHAKAAAAAHSATPPSTTPEQAPSDKVTPAADATTGKASKKGMGTKGQGNGK